MSSEWEIEHDWEIAKLLITNMNSYKMFLFKAPIYLLYIQSLRPANKFIEEGLKGIKYHFRDPKDPHIVVIRTENMDLVHSFIQEQPQFKAMKIFKHGLYFKSLDADVVKGFASTNVMNMMGLKPGATFRIKSDNKQLRGLFYQKALQHNEEHGFGCGFDYDEYDYTLEIRAYKKYRDKEHIGWAIFTILYGDDMPNYYGMQ